MVDIATVRTLLRINGLSPESPRAEIETALRTAGYTEDDIDVALKEFGQGRDVPAAVEASLAGTPATAFPPVTLSKKQEAPVASAPLWEKILGWIGVALFALFTAAFAFKVLPGYTFIMMGYEGSPQILNQFMMQIFLPAIGASIVIMLIAFFLARITNVARTLGGWTTSFLCWYAALWFGVFLALLYGLTWYRKTNVEDWMSFAFSMLTSFGLVYVQLSFSIVAGIALLIGLLSYLKRPRARTSILVRIIMVLVLIAGFSGLTYYSGAMKYPAEVLKFRQLCYLVSGTSDRQGCMNASVRVSKGDGTLDIIETRYVHYGSEGSTPAFHDGVLLFTGNDINAPETGPFLVRDGIQEPLPDGIYPQQLIVAEGKLAYMGFDKSADRYQGLLYIDGVRDTTHPDVEAVAAIHGKLAVFARNGERNYISWNGRTFQLPPGKEVASSRLQMIEVGTDSIAYAYVDAERNWRVAVDGQDAVTPFPGSLYDFTSIGGEPAFVYEIVERGVGRTGAGVQVGDARYPYSGTRRAAVALDDGIAVLVGVSGTYVPLEDPPRSIGGMYFSSSYSADPEAYKTLAIEYKGARYTGYDRITMPQSLNGKLAFATQQGSDIVIYVDGREYARFAKEGELMSFATSPGGRWLVTLGTGESAGVLYVDGERVEGKIAQAAFYGEHLMTSTVTDSTIEVFADGERIGAGFGVARPFIFDGKMIAFATDLQSKRAFVVADSGLLSEEAKKNLGQ